MAILKKITVKDVCGAVVKPDKKTHLLRIMGIASGWKNGNSAYGDFTKFTGEFIAVDVATGEQHRSGACILPGAIPDMLIGALGSEGNTSVEFAFDVGVKPSKSPTGYDYYVEPVVAPKNSEPLQALLVSVMETGKALPAPTVPAPKK